MDVRAVDDASELSPPRAEWIRQRQGRGGRPPRRLRAVCGLLHCGCASAQPTSEGVASSSANASSRDATSIFSMSATTSSSPSARER